MHACAFVHAYMLIYNMHVYVEHIQRAQTTAYIHFMYMHSYRHYTN